MSVLIKRGQPNDYKLVECVQNELAALKLYKGAVDGVYGPVTVEAVKLFQNLKSLTADGIIGAVTWSKLFPDDGAKALDRSQTAADVRVEAVCRYAMSLEGMTEKGNNRGPQIDAWAREVGIDPKSEPPWCMLFVQGCIRKVAKDFDEPDPLKPDTAHCMTLWRGVPKEWRHGPKDGRRGDIAIWKHSGDSGHTGIVLGYGLGVYRTIEGNTNGDGSREGKEVRVKNRRADDPRLVGFVRVPWQS